MPFSDLFGLEPAIAALRRSLQQDRLAGTYLLVGPPGVGKTALARAFAEAAACLTPRRDPFDACGSCASCRRARAGTQPEVVFIPPAGDQTQIWQFWDRDNRPPGILQHSLTFAPVIGRRRIYTIECADTLTEGAANSLLKVLEEPPPYAAFVLLAPHPARLLPTILSRAQTVRLRPGAPDVLAEWLAQHRGVPANRARRFAAYAEGRAGMALRLAGSAAAETELDRVLDFAMGLPEAPPLRALKLSEGLRKLATTVRALTEGDTASQVPETTDEGGEAPAKERVGRRQLGTVVELLIVFYRDLLSLSLDGEAARVANAESREPMLALAQGSPPERWMECLGALMEARRRIDRNVSISLLADHLVMTLIAGARSHAGAPRPRTARAA